MNCKHVQELLPLYVGRDLDEKRAKLVAAHLQSCAECARSAEEYREAQRLLQLFEPPPFSEASYAGIRQRVLREIGRETAAPTLPQLVARLFRPRIRWAVATALVLAVSVVAFYFVASRRNDRQQQLADSGGTVDQNAREQRPKPQAPEGPELAVSPSPPGEERDGLPPVSTGLNAGAGITTAGPADRPYQPRRRKSSGAATDPARSVAVNTPDTRSMTAKASPESNNLAEPEARDPAASEKTLRVEMQTKDPNIRIIWISHQRPKQDSLR